MYVPYVPRSLLTVLGVLQWLLRHHLGSATLNVGAVRGFAIPILMHFHDATHYPFSS